MAVTHKGDWITKTFEDDMDVIWKAMLKGYGVDRMNNNPLYDHQYGVWKASAPNSMGRVAIGIFNTPEEVVAMLRLLLASE